MNHRQSVTFCFFAGLVWGLSSCSHEVRQPAASAVTAAKKASLVGALPRLDLNLVAPARDDKSAIYWQSIHAASEPGAICHVKFGAHANDDTVKCTTALPLKGVIGTSPTGRWFVAAVGDEIWIYDTTTMKTVHRAQTDKQNYEPNVTVDFSADDTSIAYLNGLGRLVIHDLNIDATYDFANPHSVGALDTNSRFVSRTVRWMSNDRILTYSKGAVPQIHTLAMDNSISSISLDSSETNWIGVSVKVLHDGNKLLVADAAGFVGEFDARTGKQVFTYRKPGSTVYSFAAVQLTNTDRFLVTQSDDARLQATVFRFNSPDIVWNRNVQRGFHAELSSDGQRVGYVLETVSFEAGMDWHSFTVHLADKSEQPIPGVFLMWSNDAWFASEGEATLRDRNGAIFGRNLQWAPWFDPVRGTHTVWFGGGADFMRIRDGEKVPLEFDIAGTPEEPQLRVKGDPRQYNH